MADNIPIHASTTALLFFDTLNGALHPDDSGAPATIAASGYIERLVKIERASRAAGISIFYTVPEQRQDGKEWGLTVIGDPPRVTYFRGVNYKGSKFATIIPEIAPQPDDYMIAKHRWSAFFQTCLELSLRTAGLDTIMLAGGSTHVGIASTAYSARDHDFNVIILSDAVRSRPPDGDQITNDLLRKVFPRMARVLTVDEAVSKFIPCTETHQLRGH